MGLNDLKAPAKSRAARKRKGRGPGSGLGKTCGRGHKGQNSRSGGLVPRWFEGGQMPLQRRVPKRGFHNLFKKDIAIVNVRDLNRFEDGTEVDPELLQKSGLIASTWKKGDGVKVLGNGKLERKLAVKAHRFSKAAAEKIAAAGGTIARL